MRCLQYVKHVIYVVFCIIRVSVYIYVELFIVQDWNNYCTERQSACGLLRWRLGLNSPGYTISPYLVTTRVVYWGGGGDLIPQNTPFQSRLVCRGLGKSLVSQEAVVRTVSAKINYFSCMSEKKYLNCRKCVFLIINQEKYCTTKKN